MSEKYVILAVLLLIVGALSAFNFWWLAPLISFHVSVEIIFSVILAILELVSGVFVVVIQ